MTAADPAPVASLATVAPTATYRVQLHAGFTLHDAAALVPYLADLGVSHVHCSPWLAAVPGSTHGYDVVDHHRVDPERGGEAGVLALHEACREAGLGIVLDIVPNHMHRSAVPPDWVDGTSLDDPGRSYRRFFDVDDLVGIRVEDPAVFDATHEAIVGAVRGGVVQGLRIDHPDGLADPEGYLERLAQVVPGTWTVVEKVLEPGEELPASWRCAGTTGYDALTDVTQLFTDPTGRGPLHDLAREVLGELPTWEQQVETGKRLVATTLLTPEVDVLTGLAAPALPDVAPGELRAALVDLLVALPVYRAYARPGHPAPEGSERLLRTAAGADPVRQRLAEVLLHGPAELVTRFQQTTGPVMAKGVEDTACYRHLPLIALDEVGGDPGTWGVDAATWHERCTRRQAERPLGGTVLSTHDTKRSADVRARLLLLSEDPAGWSPVCRVLVSRGQHHGLDAHASLLTAQTLLGAWPLTGDRLAAYLTKATKEAKLATAWVDGDAAYDERVTSAAHALVADPEVVDAVQGWLAGHARADQLASLAAALVQLTMPGVAEVYQGTEAIERSLVDPDNRRPVDVAMLATFTDAKQQLTRTALRLRRQHAEALRGSYEPLDLGDDRFVGWVRGGRVATVAPMRPWAVSGDDAAAPEVSLPGTWVDRLDPSRPLRLLVRED